MDQMTSFEADIRAYIEAARGYRICDLVVKDILFLDVFSGKWEKGDVAVYNECIVGVGESYEGKELVDGTGLFLVPGFIDSHVHIESSLLTPENFANAVLPHGTTAVIWDPHEITNVKGIEGIEWAISCSEKSILDIFIMIPSCVPSTPPELGLETSGACLNAHDIRIYKKHKNVLGLAEMMNYPGVLNADADILDKLANFSGKARDGHAPGLRGKDLSAYALCGIRSCHESIDFAEAQEKLRKGMHVLIREGSCAKNAKILLPLVDALTSSELALCSDDRNAFDINFEGHIDHIVNIALQKGMDPVHIFRVASYAPAKIYGLGDRGAIAPGYLADFLLIRQKQKDQWNAGMSIEKVFKAGKVLSPDDQTVQKNIPFKGKNLNVAKYAKNPFDIFRPELAGQSIKAHVIEVKANQIVTGRREHDLTVTSGGYILPDIENDILPIAVLERHTASGNIGRGLVKGFTLKRGAIATSINHDCHNIIVTGTKSDVMYRAFERLCHIDGGIVVMDDDGSYTELPLEVGGLMSYLPFAALAARLKDLKEYAQRLGCCLQEPFLQLSFLALPVIPELKITDKGLCDGRSFRVIDFVK